MNNKNIGLGYCDLRKTIFGKLVSLIVAGNIRQLFCQTSNEFCRINKIQT